MTRRITALALLLIAGLVVTVSAQTVFRLALDRVWVVDGPVCASGLKGTVQIVVLTLDASVGAQPHGVYTCNDDSVLVIQLRPQLRSENPSHESNQKGGV